MKKCLWIMFVGVGFAVASCGGASPNSNITANASASPEKADKKQKKDKDKSDETSSANSSPAASEQCDKSLWNRVYEPDRLEVLDECKTVTGTITERDADDDGDEHMLLKLDDGQDDLLTKKNKKKKDDNLVIEAVCVNPPKLKKVGDTCSGYTSTVHLPQVGDHVRVTGSLVDDTHNGWNEIHPITQIELIR